MARNKEGRTELYGSRKRTPELNHFCKNWATWLAAGMAPSSSSRGPNAFRTWCFISKSISYINVVTGIGSMGAENTSMTEQCFKRSHQNMNTKLEIDFVTHYVLLHPTRGQNWGRFPDSPTPLICGMNLAERRAIFSRKWETVLAAREVPLGRVVFWPNTSVSPKGITQFSPFG